MFSKVFSSAMFLSLMAATSASYAECPSSTSSTVVAIPFNYDVVEDKGRWLMLSATSNDIEWGDVDEGWPVRYKPFREGGGGAITEWRLDSVPANGVLYESGTRVAAGDVISDPDELYYEPDLGFVGEDAFGYCVRDSSGGSNVAQVNLRVSSPNNYPMPIGISDPGFGIAEEPPEDPAAWPSAESAGNYYIDGNHASCTDANDYGYPDVPRCSFAYGMTVGAGQKMVIKSDISVRNSSWDIVTLNGTASNPAWIIGDERGVDKPKINRPSGRSGGVALRIAGTGNWRISGVDIDGVNIDNRSTSENIVVRYSRIQNVQTIAGTALDLNCDTEPAYTCNGSESNQMVFQVYANDNGIIEANLRDEHDVHAITVSNNRNMWILDIMCAEMAGDCVQLTNNNTSYNVLVGRAAMHSMMENCTDYKDFNNFVVSESDCWDIRMVSYSSGSGGYAQNFYVNDEGNQRGYGYFLNNRSWDTSGTNFGSANVGGKVYFIGNVAFFSPVGDGLSSVNGSGDRYYFLNTVDDMRRGMFMYTAGGSGDRYVYGNAVGDVSQYAVYAAASTSDLEALNYNFYYNASQFAWGSNSNPNVGSMSAFRSATGFDANSRTGSPGYFNESLYDFRLLSSSAMQSVVPASVANTFNIVETDLGISLVDFTGEERSGSMDAGASEFAGLQKAPPAPPLDARAEQL